jgi:spermidine synthase
MQKRPTAQMAVHLLAFFVTAMVCHGELARLRPRVRHLTEFYLWLSVGGMLGGLFNALVAPVLFATVLEYPIALVLACALRPRTGEGPERAISRWLDVALPVITCVAIVLVLRKANPESWFEHGSAVFWIVTALACLSYAGRPIRLALGVAAMLVGAAIGRDDRETVVLTQRSFFGVYRVRKYPAYRLLQHGTTTHGGQLLAADMRREPITYYHRDGPLGHVFATVATTSPRRNVAIVGLGTGTVACYGRTGERWTFYEIDPLVQRIARDPRYFSYLRDCPPVTNVVLGDARLSLVTAPDGAYDIIILDAFSSDAIPAHLMTREALALYLQKLAPGGVIAFHISNRYVDLQPVLTELARDARVAGSVGEDFKLSSAQTAMYKSTSKWVVLARRAADIAELTMLPQWRPLPPQADVRLWTDDFSDIFSVFKWR